jgi:N-acetylglucosamine malate deacetylase 2
MTLRSAVAFFAHPDDETVLAGGILALLSKMRIPTHIVSATRGEGGDTQDLMLSQAELGRIREAELRCAAQQLGASVETLGYVDPIIGADDLLYPFEADFNTLVRQIIEIIRARSASLVLTHSGNSEDSHPAHQLLYRAVSTAVQEVYPAVLLYSVTGANTEAAHFALDIRPWAQEKMAAMECYATQQARYLSRHRSRTVRDAMQTIESVWRVLPETHGELPGDAFAQLLRTAGAWTPEQGVSR